MHVRDCTAGGAVSQADCDAIIQTPIGFLGIITDGGAVTGVTLGLPPCAPIPPRNAVAGRAVHRLEAYFRDPSAHPDVSTRLRGTPFQQRVWEALRLIPPGRTRTYGELAQRLGTSARAVGGACRANPCPVIVPCHRVIAAGGGLGGFSGHRNGAWLDIKKQLLALEAARR
jgi:methylated-DNA-[protein]-cysteine S-methyltransferase